MQKSAQNTTPSLMIVTGEASGDLHGARVINEIKKLIPNINCFGIGGANMRHAGMTIDTDVAELSVAGLVEVLKHYPRLKKILNKTRNILRQRRPDLLILIDSPDFNLPLAKTAKHCGVKVLYYISPQIWAWRKSRIKQIKKNVDMMAVVFPFEEQFYHDAGVPVKYVGHPLVNNAKAKVEKSQFIHSSRLDPNKKLIGLFPGSRASEIEHNYPTLLEAANLILQARNDVQFITPIASTLSTACIKDHISKAKINIKTTSDDIYNVINACDAIAAASGTVTLQITLMQVPMLIVYKISPATYRILRKIVKFTFAGIANVIANKEISREFIQENATAENIASELQKLITDKEYIKTMKKNMAMIKEMLGEKDGSVSTARLAAELISTK